MVQLFYTTYISVDLVHHKIFRAKVGKGGKDRYTIWSGFIVSDADYKLRGYFDSSVFELPRLRNSYIMGCPLVCGDNPRA